MPITFERKSLYEEVWTKPLTHLGKKYALSDNGLRKICEAMNIPLPPAGHWARIAAGHAAVRIPLPESAERTTFYSDPPVQLPSYRTQEDDAWLKERDAFESQPQNAIVVDLRPRRWHAAVSPLRDRHVDAEKRINKARAEAERYERMSPEQKRFNSNLGVDWRIFIDRGQILIDTHRAIPLKVSMVTYERALAIANSLCWSAQARGFTIKLNENSGRIEMSGHGGEVELRIAEVLEKKIVREKRWGAGLENFERKTPTGLLRVYLGGRGAERGIEETRADPIEGKMNSVFLRIYRMVVRCRESIRESEARQRRWAEEKRLREAAEKQRAEQERIRKEERSRREALISEAQRWKQAAVLREYLAHIQRVAPRSDSAEAARRTGEWLQWASGVADDLDPTPRKLP